MNSSEWSSFVMTAIGNFGFPIVVTGYLLMRFEKRIDHLTQSIQSLAQIIREGGKQK
ncbi:YvrJ family protein [Thermobacillus sp. ZCTH02-B1]|uniref:YvrJ family protein n=1 Tax=Thermobacillus sp. ZCTH02-B1 TaxID=1858795 RepID=UPI0025F04068|nr:YvrJ family protein [Thermobacillus sp. ZCTH02-B1]